MKLINYQGDNMLAEPDVKKKLRNLKIQKYLLALLFIFILSILGLGISLFIKVFIPFWIVFGFSLIFSIEKWFSYQTRKCKFVGNLYRLLLNFSILVMSGLIIWSGVKLFTHQFVQSPIIGSLIFIAEFIFFVWIWRIVARERKQWPSMKLTIFSLVAVFVILAFAGVEPVSNYKDNILNRITDFLKNISKPSTQLDLTIPTPVTLPPPTSPSPTPTQPVPSAVATTVLDRIDPKNGEYKNFYLGLVRTPEVQGGNGGYDITNKFIVLINNKNAKNPTYSELVNFLQSNKIDEYPYQLSFRIAGFYSGQAEDKINLTHLKEIIDGTTLPNPPQVCADFAERLHNEAETAGIRSGYVVIDSLSHALNVFQTTDRGLVFIDDTGKSNTLQPFTIPFPNSIMLGQTNSWDKVAYLEDGKPYGLIDLSCAQNFGLDYSGYERWLTAKKDLDNLANEYDRLVAGRIFVPPNIYEQAQGILAQIQALANKLGGFWDSLGIVNSYYITWDGSWRDRK